MDGTIYPTTDNSKSYSQPSDPGDALNLGRLLNRSKEFQEIVSLSQAALIITLKEVATPWISGNCFTRLSC